MPAEMLATLQNGSATGTVSRVRTFEYTSERRVLVESLPLRQKQRTTNGVAVPPDATRRRSHNSTRPMNDVCVTGIPWAEPDTHTFVASAFALPSVEYSKNTRGTLSA